jgi:hypothetical protein
MSIVNQVVDRLHVSASERDVAFALNKVLKKKHRTDPRLFWERVKLYRAGIERHKTNQELFYWIAKGMESERRTAL